MSEIKEETIIAANLAEINHVLEKFILLMPEERELILDEFKFLHAEISKSDNEINWSEYFITSYIRVLMKKDLMSCASDEDREKISLKHSKPWMEVF